MAVIEVMDDYLSNQIAAGEVVDRPASVVKELVENAIDAQGSNIEVHVENGGLDAIKVIDNGLGMSREDSRLAFERHATSKLSKTRDLFRIATLGFRGEALPSIAAISQVTLQTWNQTEETGTKVIVEGGEMRGIEDSPLRKGTSVHVQGLFYNTPARYKYVKTVHTELSHITDYMNRLALAYPHIAFALFHNGRTLLKTAGIGKRRDVIASIYGHKTAKQMIPFSATHIDFEVEGFLGKPSISRSSRAHITTLINGRYVKNFRLSKAVQQAYHTLLPVHRYPLAVLSLSMEPSLVDVNVHPSKLEVRLSKEKECTEWLEAECKKALRAEQLIPEPYLDMKQKEVKKKSEQPQLDLRLPEKKEEAPHTHQLTQSPSPTYVERGQSTLKKVSESEERLASESEERVKPNAVIPSAGPDENSSHVTNIQEDETLINEMIQQPEHVREHGLPPAHTQQGTEYGEQQTNRGKSGYQIPLLSPLSQLHGTYILAQNDDGLYMIDQHAAQERIWYERYVQKLNEPERVNQSLTVPLVLEFTSSEAALIEEHHLLLEQAGLFLESFGHHAFMIRSYPNWFPEGEEEALIREVIHFVTEHKRRMEWIELRDEMAMMMSCKQAIKANQHLSYTEMEALVEALRHSSNPYTCPHGRPIIVLLSKYDIEKMFKRVM